MAVTVNDDRYRAHVERILFEKIEWDDIENIWSQKAGVTCYIAEATLDVLRPVFEEVEDLMSFGHLGATIRHRWTTTCGVPSTISVTRTRQRQLKL